jgi:DNA topoisomerase-1
MGSRARAKKHVRAIAEALKTDDTLILATDPDREGEAISWHLQGGAASSLKKGKKVARVTFNAITKDAVTRGDEGTARGRQPLVDAYLARRALDYLVGFTLSPVLWRKLPGARSAGRVQSVCLRLIVEREMEIEAFKSREYWTVGTSFAPRADSFLRPGWWFLAARSWTNSTFRRPKRPNLRFSCHFEPSGCRRWNRSPPAATPLPPFMTSTLQQEASRKYGLGARATMNAAQRLYEAGHITYMRTDGIDMAPEAMTGRPCRDRPAVRRRLCPGQAAHLPEQGKECAGSA